MAAISTQALDTQTGALTFTAASASDTCEGPTTAGKMFAVFKGGAGSDTVAITMSQTTQYGETLPAPGAPNYTLGAAQTTTLFIPLYPEFVNPATGLITITHSASTSVTCAIVRMG